MEKSMNEKITKSITKTYRKTIWKRTLKALDEYQLLKEGDVVAVCLSGGKDSFLLACVLKEIQKHSKYKFTLKYLVMDPGYTKEHLDLIKENAEIFELDLNIFNSNIFEDIKDEKSPCYFCARKRRGFLYNKARELGCNKISLGHHFNDVIETVLLNMFYNGVYGSMLPKLKSDHYPGMELIRPLYLVKEYDIVKWVKYNNLNFLDCACSVATKKVDSKRLEMKNLIEELVKIHEDIDINIFNSTTNVNLNTIIKYKLDNKETTFLDNYDK
ncbi:MAG: tRNA 2-thiocytidine biosynthesis protein TtcA [Mollicutes bacterium]|nr:tRNA 2-thiocytidine biosynthesis protein TtcA [Mollicutes bacterium]